MKNFFNSWYYTVVMPKIELKQNPILKPLNQEEIEKNNKSFNIFFCWQILWEDNEISNYSYIALKLDKDTYYDYDKIEKIYWIKHNISIDDTHIIFIFDKFISDKKQYNNFCELFEFIYPKSIATDFIPMPWTMFYREWYLVKAEIINEEYLDLNKLTLLYSFLLRYKNQDIFKQEISKDNLIIIKNKLNYIAVSTILKNLWITYNEKTFNIQWDENWKIDESKNLIIDLWDKWNPCWWPFFFVLLHKNWRIDETLEWFNNNLKTNFKLDKEEINIIKSSSYDEWIKVLKWDWFFTNDLGYMKMWEKPFQLTNFVIKVFYKIEKLDWTKEYIIQLINPITWEQTSQVNMINSHSKTKLKEFLSSFWWFYFYWWENDITSILKSINLIEVPIIKNMLWLWFHWDKLILWNWIFNIKTKRLTLIDEWEKFLFDDEWKWYQVSINNWKSFFDVFKPWETHKFNTTNKVYLPSDIWNTFDKMYKWDVWLLLLMYIYWQIAFWVFKDFSDDIRYPLLLTYWLTQSWKTEYIETFARIYWATWELNNFNWTSAFMFLTLISTFKWLPVFFSEYREKWIKDIDSKKNKIRNLFDRKWEWKWKSDQSIISYKYIANMAMEWEETISDPATRSRSLMIHMSKKNKLEKVSDFKELTHSWEVTNLLYTYLRWFNYDYIKYNEYFLDCQNLLESQESRIKENFSRIYAWCMLFDKTKKEEYIKILTKYIELANKDQKDNQWYMAFFNAIAMNIRNIYSYWTDDSPFYVPENFMSVQYPHFFLKIDKLQEYFRVKRVPLELEFDTYLSYMADWWFDYWLHEVWDQWMMFAIKIPITKDIPKQLLVIKDVFDAYKKLEAKWLF